MEKNKGEYRVKEGRGMTEKDVNIKPKMSVKELAIINLEGSEGSYGKFIVNMEDSRKVLDLIIDEKTENEGYSVETVQDRIEKAGIYIYESEEIEADFGM